jgi:hypothetical protein
MRSTRLAVVILLGAIALSSTATAQRVELAGRVTAARTVLSQRRVGEARYVAISDLFYQDLRANLEVLDLATLSVVQIQAKRALLEKQFGRVHDGAVSPPQGEIVVYRDGIVGVALSEAAAGPTRHYWYAELDARTGKLVRRADLATVRSGDQLQVVGADADGTAAWFAITEVRPRGRTVLLRRLDLGSLERRDEQRVALTVRGGRDHAVHIYAAADFSRFAVVEYYEDGVQMAPGQVYIADPAAATVITIPAPPTTYGVAFSPDRKYVYLGSAQRGTISRVDVAAGRIDKQVAAPRNLHHLVVSPSGTKLLALATSATYAVYDLPDLKVRSDATHVAAIAPAMIELHGEGVASLDGAFFVVPDVEDRRRLPRDRTYVVARIVE